MQRVVVALVGLLVAPLATGCAEERLIAPSGPAGSYAVTFTTADLSTHNRVATIRLYNQGVTVISDTLNTVATSVKVASWPDGDRVVATRVITSEPGGQLPGGGEIQPYDQIDVRLDDSVAGSGWYAVSIAALPPRTRWMNESALFLFADQSRGVRIAPDHPPIVASVMACPKAYMRVAVYVRYSEPVSGTTGAVTLDFGLAAARCAMGAESMTETQLICEGSTGTEPFSLHIGDTITSQAAGTPMAARTFTSSDMQVSVQLDGCAFYKPLVP